MPIPLVGIPAPAVKYEDLLTGDSSVFASSVGNWVNSGGTQTRDTTGAYLLGSLTGSLKLVTTASGQYTEVAIPGTFLAGKRYDALIVLVVEESPASLSYSATFGLQGTDVQTVSATQTGSKQPGAGLMKPVALSWTPTANRTGVTLRIARAGAESGTQTWHVSYARAVRVEDGPGLWMFRTPGGDGTTGLLLAGDFGDFHVSHPAGASLTLSNLVDLEGEGGLSGVYLTSVFANFWGSHAAGSRAAGGIYHNMGSDFLGLYWSERSSTEIEAYPDGDYDVTLLDGSSGSATRHWHAATADGTKSRLGAYFEHVLTVAGALTTGTDKAQYWQAPYNMRIDEIRVHVGTAPTGASLICDFNDDGTTVFTTQGNRPTIAISGTDATSGAADGGVSIAKNSVMTLDIDQVGSTIAGSDLYVSIRGRYIW